MLRSILRKSFRTVRAWLEEENRGKRAESASSPPRYSYPWLNDTLFPKILKDGSGRFRPKYAWGVIQAANLAHALDVKRISVAEFGVAGGNGLLSLEAIAKQVAVTYGLSIDVYGFDTGRGLPRPEDYRDLPNIFSPGTLAMDVDKLRQRLESATLVLGLVEETIKEFVQSDAAPLAFMAIDLDYYSSTTHALEVLNANEDILLPRIHCYFDDILGITCGDHNGERLAISEFNSAHADRKISPIYGLRFYLPKPYADQMWSEKYFMAHIFDHKRYGDFDNLNHGYELSLEG